MGAPPATSTATAPTSIGVTDMVTRGMRVVVVDNRHERRQLMGHVIALGGDDVVVVGYADDEVGALEAVRGLAADAVVIEIQLPVERGLAIVAALRHEYPDLPIVVCSFHADPATRAEATALGADGYLVKPISPRDVYRELLRRTPAVP